MQYEIRNFNGAQAGKVLAMVNFVIGLILAVMVGIGLLFGISGENQPGIGFVAVMPFLYAIAGYVGTRIFVAIYNRIAARRGGIYLELGELYDPMDPPWKP
jgi:hypothetical protein